MKKYLYFYISIIIFVYIIFNIFLSDHYYHTKLSPDENLYNSIALALLNKSKIALLGSFEFDIGQEVTPFYPILISLSYFIFPSIKSVIIMQILFSSVTLILLFLLIKKITSDILISFFTIIGFSLYYPLWAYNYYLMMEITSVFLLTLTIYFFTIYYFKSKVNYLYYSLIIFSFLVLLNNRFVVLLIGLIFFLVYLYLFKHVKLKIINIFIAIIIPTLLFCPWFLRQYKTYDQFIFFTPLWTNVIAEKIGIFKNIDIENIEDKYYNNKIPISNQLIKPEADTLARNKFLLLIYDSLLKNQQTKENIYIQRLKRYFTLYDNKFHFLYPGYDNRLIKPTSFPTKIIQLFILLPLILFSFISIPFAFLRNNLLIKLFLFLFVLHICLHILIHYIDRYRLTILPILVVLATYGFKETLDFFKSKYLFGILKV